MIKDVARTVNPAVRLDVIKEDPDDNRILECASAEGSDYIVSGDTAASGRESNRR